MPVGRRTWVSHSRAQGLSTVAVAVAVISTTVALSATTNAATAHPTTDDPATITVAVLQPPGHTPPAARIATATQLVQRAAAQGVHVALLPELWEPDAGAAHAYASLAASFCVALGVPYGSAGGNSSAVLIDATGAVVLTASKPYGNASNPTVSPAPAAAALTIPHAAASVSGLTSARGASTRSTSTATTTTIHVGFLLGSDRMFLEVSRPLMMQGADLLLVPSGQDLTDVDLHVLSTRAASHVTTIAAAGYAEGGNSAVFGFCGSTGNWTERAQVLHALTGGTVTPPVEDGPVGCADQVVLPPWATPGLATQRMNLTYQHHIRTQGIMGDVARHARQYAPMCWDDMRQTQAIDPSHTNLAKARAGASARDAPFNVTVALLQMQGVTVDPGADPTPAHMAKGDAFVRTAARLGADVALFPELFSVGYSVNYPAGTPEDPSQHDSRPLFNYMSFAQRVDGAYIQHFRQLARELDIAIAVTLLEDISAAPIGAWAAGGRTPFVDRFAPRNAVVLIDRHGEVVYVYAKVHTVFMSPHEVVTTAGRGWYSGVLNTRRGNVTAGSIICFDREHDESARGAMLAGAELLLLPTACHVNEAMLDAVSSRAAENALAVAMSNYAATPTQPWSPGRSAGYDHTGARLLSVEDDDEGVHLVSFDIAALRAYRATARGQALTHPPASPQVCQLPKATPFRGVSGAQEDPGYGAYVRLNNAL